MKTIKLMADYFCSPLWRADLSEVGNIDPSSLPISQDIQEELLRWAEEYDRTLDADNPKNSGFKSEREEFEFREKGTRLVELLRNELGPEYTVRVQF